MLGRIIPHDVTVVLVASAEQISDSHNGRQLAETPVLPPALSLAVLDVPAMQTGVSQGRPGYGAALPERTLDDNLWCAAALHGDGIVAWAWFTGGAVSASLNSGGSRFAGIGLQLPRRCAFVFKVHVLPEWRGSALAATLIAHGTRHAPHDSLNTVITTTAIDNSPFRRSADSSGFERRDWAAEFVVGHRHFFRLPKPLTLADGRQITFHRGLPPPNGR